MLATRTNVKGVIERVLDVADAWLEAHFEWIVCGVVLAGLALRILRAADLYFNGDEAMIMFAPSEI